MKEITASNIAYITTVKAKRAVANSFFFRVFVNGCRPAARAFRTLRQVVALVCLVGGFQAAAQAPCTTFINADASNPVYNQLPLYYEIADVAFTDIDNDGDLDFYVKFTNYTIALYRNVGSARFPQYALNATSGFENDSLPVSTGLMQFVDINGDGLPDCFMSTEDFNNNPSSHILYYKNIGTAANPKFAKDDAENPVSFVTCPTATASFTFADIDKDGDWDLYSFDSTKKKVVYRNTGTAQAAAYTVFSVMPKDTNIYRSYYDWNKDGLPDYFEFNETKNTAVYYQNTGTLQNPAYTRTTAGAPQFLNAAPFSWVDLNQDGVPEIFNAVGSNSLLTPAAVIDVQLVKNKNRVNAVLFSHNKSSEYQYAWYYNHTLVRGHKADSLHAVRSGTYTLTVTDSCGTGTSLPYAFTVTILSANMNQPDMNVKAAAASSANAEITAKAYPNPFTNTITVVLPQAAKAGNYTIRVIDLSGKTALTQTSSATSIQVGRTLPKGVYLLQVWQANAIVYRTTIIKQE